MARRTSLAAALAALLIAFAAAAPPPRSDVPLAWFHFDGDTLNAADRVKGPHAAVEAVRPARPAFAGDGLLLGAASRVVARMDLSPAAAPDVTMGAWIRADAQLLAPGETQRLRCVVCVCL